MKVHRNNLDETDVRQSSYKR